MKVEDLAQGCRWGLPALYYEEGLDCSPRSPQDLPRWRAAAAPVPNAPARARSRSQVIPRTEHRQGACGKHSADSRNRVCEDMPRSTHRTAIVSESSLRSAACPPPRRKPLIVDQSEQVLLFDCYGPVEKALVGLALRLSHPVTLTISTSQLCLKSIWSRQLGETGLVFAPKLTDCSTHPACQLKHSRQPARGRARPPRFWAGLTSAWA